MTASKDRPPREQIDRRGVSLERGSHSNAQDPLFRLILLASSFRWCAECSHQAACHHRDARLVRAYCHHAFVYSFDHHADAMRPQDAAQQELTSSVLP
jgi:hypothetical protein